MAGRSQAWRVIQRLADDMQPAMRRRYLAAIEKLQNSISLARLAAAIERGDVLAIDRELIGARLEAELLSAVDLVTQLTRDALRVEALRIADHVRLNTAFTRVNPFAVQAAQRQGARLITRVSAESRAAVRAVIADSVNGGRSPQQAAKEIRTIVGLTARQTKAVQRLRVDLSRAGRTQAQIDAAAERYAARLLRQRATMIARTETIAAANAGQNAAWQQAQAAGLLPHGVKRTWITTPDDRLCPQCAEVGGQVVGLDEPFATPLGAVMFPPLHPNCRCAIALDVASLAVSARSQRAA